MKYSRPQDKTFSILLASNWFGGCKLWIFEPLRDSGTVKPKCQKQLIPVTFLNELTPRTNTKDIENEETISDVREPSPYDLLLESYEFCTYAVKIDFCAKLVSKPWKLMLRNAPECENTCHDRIWLVPDKKAWENMWTVPHFNKLELFICYINRPNSRFYCSFWKSGTLIA